MTLVRVLLLIVLALIVGGGAAYFVTKSSKTSDPNDIVSSAGNDTIAKKHFSWRDVSFDYPATWQANVLTYGHPIEGLGPNSNEIGFEVMKTGFDRGPQNWNDFYIVAGGPQSGEQTCADLNLESSRCADLKRDPSPGERITHIAVYTLSNNQETLSVFHQIVESAKNP